MKASIFKPSTQQVDFFQWILTERGSCVLEAVAGSGKTTTLVEALKIMDGSIFFGAYNKKIADEIQLKAGNKVGLVVNTFHAAGNRAWKKIAPKAQLDGNKCRNLYRAEFSGNPDYFKFESPVLALVSYAKQAAIGAINSAADVSLWYFLVDHFNVDCLGEDEIVVEAAQRILAKSVENDMKIIDFDDMIYCPLVHHVKIDQYDWVLIDEAQDTNASRRALALLMLKRGGRLIAVGDRHQAIYGFTGADADALDLIANAVNAVQMPLTVTYRCPKAVVVEARKYVSHITAHESAIEGTVSHLKGDIVLSAKVGDAILCRFNAPIIELVYRFIAEGIPAKVEGREIGASMKTLVKRYKAKSYSVLVDRLDGYAEREGVKLRIKERESQAVAIQDKVNCIKVIIDRVQKIDPKNANPVDRVCQEIDTIFENDVNAKCVLLSTIHKSKGREWKNVYWLQTGASKWARMDWEKEQEQNLNYVAVTRAQEHLILCPASGVNLEAEGEK
jgi:DNA helicase II / ATP-dependent DNA helicase PcrA